MKNGKISEVGTHDELMSQGEGFAEFLRNYASKEANKEKEDDDPGKLASCCLRLFSYHKLHSSL